MKKTATRQLPPRTLAALHRAPHSEPAWLVPGALRLSVVLEPSAPPLLPITSNSAAVKTDVGAMDIIMAATLPTCAPVQC